MPRDLRAFLWDAIAAANDIREFVKDIGAEDYARTRC